MKSEKLTSEHMIFLAVHSLPFDEALRCAKQIEDRTKSDHPCIVVALQAMSGEQYEAMRMDCLMEIRDIMCDQVMEYFDSKLGT